MPEQLLHGSLETVWARVKPETTARYAAVPDECSLAGGDGRGAVT